MFALDKLLVRTFGHFDTIYMLDSDTYISENISCKSKPASDAAVSPPPVLLKLRDWLWLKIQEQLGQLFEELSPWLRWVIWDALLTILIRFIVTRSPSSKAFFKFLGLLG